MPDNRWLKKTLLTSLVGAMAVGALMGIYVFVVGDFGETEVRILLTTLSLTYFNVTSLSCTPVMERRRGLLLAGPGLAASFLGLGWALALIWLEWDSQPMGRAMAVLVILAFSFAQACLLRLPRLKARLRWVRVSALVFIFSLAAVLSAIVFDLDDELMFRLAGVLAILDACASLAIPVLYKLGGAEPVPVSPPKKTPEGVGSEIELVCPACGHKGVYPTGSIECSQCALRIRVEIDRPSGRAGRARLQFSLKTMLLAFVVVSLPLGWFGFRMGQLRRQAAVVAELEPMKPQVRYRYGNVITVSFFESDPEAFDAAVLTRLGELPKLTLVDLSNMPITPEELTCLNGSGIELLVLVNTPVSADAVARFEKANPQVRVRFEPLAPVVAQQPPYAPAGE